MSTANELLNSMTLMGEAEEHILIGADRIISVPPSLRKIAVEGDHNVETVTFDCPRYWDDGRVDLSTMTVYVNYMRADGTVGSYHAADVAVDEDDPTMIHFSWTLSRHVTQAKGTLSFLICIKEVNEDGEELRHWNSELNSEMTVSAGMEVSETVVAKHPDIITQILKDIAYLKENGTGGSSGGGTGEPGAPGADGEDGGYYSLSLEQTEAGTLTVSYSASKPDMPVIEPKTFTLPAGPQGPAYTLTDPDKEAIVEATVKALGNDCEPAETDLPRIFFTGHFPASKLEDDGSAVMEYISKTKRFKAYVSVKVQGSSSTTFKKKNYTFKLFSDEAHSDDAKMKVSFRNWPAKNKFVAKANTIDRTHARNVVSCRIWGDMVKSREGYDDLPEALRNSPNLGAIDGFPVQIYLNGVYQGLYTWNIPKDDWMAGLDEDMKDQHAIICGEGSANATTGFVGSTYVSFNAEYGDGITPINGYDWEDELGTVGDNIRTNFKELVSLVVNGTDAEFKAGISRYINLESLIDTYIWKFIACDIDGLGKNQFMYTFSGGLPWYCGVYDQDSTWGLKPEGTDLVSFDTAMPDGYYCKNNRLFARVWDNFQDEIRVRWNEVKNRALSLANIINHFESFHDAIPLDLFAEDSADTTANGYFVTTDDDEHRGFTGTNAIVGVDRSNIQQLRNFAAARWTYVDSIISHIKCEGITLDKTAMSLTAENNTVALVATVTPADCNDPVVWTTDKESVATVIGGSVTAIGNGSCKITATCGEYSATCSVTVSGFAEGEVGYDNLADPKVSFEEGGDWYFGYYYSPSANNNAGGIIPGNGNLSRKIEFRAGDVLQVSGCQVLYGGDGYGKYVIYDLDGNLKGRLEAYTMYSNQEYKSIEVKDGVSTITLSAHILGAFSVGEVKHGYIRLTIGGFENEDLHLEDVVIHRNPNGENAEAWA